MAIGLLRRRVRGDIIGTRQWCFFRLRRSSALFRTEAIQLDKRRDKSIVNISGRQLPLVQHKELRLSHV